MDFMMMTRNFALLFFVFGLFSMAQVAQAEPKFLGLWWKESHWKNQDFNPHYDNGTDPHTSQWTEKNWSPADWIKSAGGDGTQLVTGWINAGILVGSYKDSDGVPTLEIGSNFYHLSGYDKRRVTQTLDAIYQVTAVKPSMYFIKDADTQKIIGTYTKEGLNLE